MATHSTARLAAAAPAYGRLQYRLAWVTVMTPLVGVILAIVLAWGRGIGPVELWMLGIGYVLGVVGVEVGLHRHFSHRAFQAHPAVRAGLAILGSMAAQGPVLFWVATHRRHHSFSDRVGDPHSPHGHGEGLAELLKGLWHAHVGWLFQGDSTDLGLYARDLLGDRLVFRISQFYFVWLLAGLAVPAAIGGLITRTWTGCALGFVWGGLVRTFLVHHATWSVNSLCHVFGDRPFRTSDRSTNNGWLALSSLGGSWHNNHHGFQWTATNSFEWWQVDACGWVIRGLEVARLAWDVKVPDERMKREFAVRRRDDEEKR
jgi:stearoyl-CoA desaturase (delta-9 desaturase)